MQHLVYFYPVYLVPRPIKWNRMAFDGELWCEGKRERVRHASRAICSKMAFRIDDSLCGVAAPLENISRARTDV